jgi:ABC-2 type transport system permease protein
MILAIARKEWVELLRDGRFRGAAALVFLLAAVGIAVGALHVRSARTEREEGTRLTRQHWLEQGEKNPHSAAHYGVWAFKPESPLAAFDRGVEPYLGVAVYLEAHKQNLTQYRPAADATAAARFGELTGAGVLQLLVPLLIVLLTFAAFTTERENGTLRLLLSTGVRRHQLVLGKALGVGLALAMLLVPILAVSAGLLVLSGAAPGEVLGRAAVMVLGHGLYLAGFVFLGLAVSAWVRSSRVALVVLLAVWMVNGLLVPRLAADAARTWLPVPEAQDFARQLAEDYERGLSGHDPADQRLAALERQTLERYGVASLEQLPINFRGLALQAGEEYGNKVNAARFGELEARYHAQERLHLTFAPLSPVLALRQLSSAMARTDLDSHLRFMRQAEAYRQGLVKQMNDAVTYRSKYGDTGYKADVSLWREVPDFQADAGSVREALASQTPGLLLLAFWLLWTTVLALRAGARLSAV